jgi:hypothetical protein
MEYKETPWTSTDTEKALSDAYVRELENVKMLAKAADQMAHAINVLNDEPHRPKHWWQAFDALRNYERVRKQVMPNA